MSVTVQKWKEDNRSSLSAKKTHRLHELRIYAI